MGEGPTTMGCGSGKDTQTETTCTSSGPSSNPLFITVQNKWNDGQTKEQVVKALKDMGEKAMTVDGVYAFQYAINEETKTNQVTEIYRDAGCIQAFFAAPRHRLIWLLRQWQTSTLHSSSLMMSADP